MPIKGLTSGRQRMLPRVGKIHLGIKVQHANGNEYPRAVDYFVFPEEVQEIVHRLYGPEPRELDIILPSDDTDIIAPAWYKAYLNTGQAVCKGDGASADRLIFDDQMQRDPDTGFANGPIAKARRNEQNRDRPASRYTIRCPGRDCEYYGSKDCKEVMHLQFLLPDIPGFGIWQLDTGSYWSITQIYDSIAYLQMFGDIAGMRLKLTLEPREVTRPDGGRNTVYTLHLRHDGTFYQMLEAGQKPAWQALPEGTIPTPDESRNELLYPTNGFAPEEPAQSQPLQGEVVDESSGAARLQRDLDALHTADDYSDFVLHFPDDTPGWVKQETLKSAERKGFTYSKDFAAFVAAPQPDSPVKPENAQNIERARNGSAGEPNDDPALGWIDETNAAAMAEAVAGDDAPPVDEPARPPVDAEGRPVCKVCRGSLNPLDEDTCQPCLRDQQVTAGQQEMSV